MGANAVSRPRTQPDPPRIFAEVKVSPFELSPTATDTQNRPNFPDDTEEYTSIPATSQALPKSSPRLRIEHGSQVGTCASTNLGLAERAKRTFLWLTNFRSYHWSSR